MTRHAALAGHPNSCIACHPAPCVHHTWTATNSLIAINSHAGFSQVVSTEGHAVIRKQAQHAWPTLCVAERANAHLCCVLDWPMLNLGIHMRTAGVYRWYTAAVMPRDVACSGAYGLGLRLLARGSPWTPGSVVLSWIHIGQAGEADSILFDRK